jgi:predicted RNA binding protein YcfA (HicA-like mRNA interferase family)
MRVREVIRTNEAGGWYLVATKGSHRQYKHRGSPAGSPLPAIPATTSLPGP